MTACLSVRKIMSSTSVLIALSLANHAGAREHKEYIVKLKDTPDAYDFNELRIATNSFLKVTDKNDAINLIKVKVGTEDHHSDVDAIMLLNDYFDAEYVVENLRLYALSFGSDPLRDKQWALDTVKAEAAWDISLGSQAVVVAVIDTGVDGTHEELVNNLWVNKGEVAGNNIDDDKNGFVDDVHGWDFHANDKDPDDEIGANPGHGTHCAGIIGASCGNNLGVCGISPTVSIMALRFLGSDGSGDLFAATKAIDYAAKNGAHIISASFGAAMPRSGAQPIIDAIKNAEDRGVIFVAAAGNEGKSNDSFEVYPANAGLPNMIAVAASDKSDVKASWSNYGRKVDLAAPGEDIWSTIPGDYKSLSGTSMAAPLVSGIVALMKSLDLSLKGAVARSILQYSGDQVSIETASNRRVLANEALLWVRNKRLLVVPAAHTLKQNDTFDFSAWGGNPPYRFRSLHPEIATITEEGHLVAESNGDVTIEVTDASDNKATSLSVKVSDQPPPAETCPFPNEFLCLILCGINPAFPWCSDLPLPILPLPLP